MKRPFLLANDEITKPIGKTVLIVDDNPVNRKVAQRLLENCGYIIDLAIDGQDAVIKCQEYYKEYSAVLMDYRMPHMNGVEATLAIRAMENDRHLPIIALTSDSDAIKKDCLKAGMDAFLEKPINIEELIKTLKRYIDN